MAERTADNLYWMAVRLNTLMDTEEGLGEMANPLHLFTVEMGNGEFCLNLGYEEIYSTRDPNGPPMDEVIEEALEKIDDRINAWQYARKALEFLRQSNKRS